ncbi:hypothetical protein IHN59_16450, partial [Deinococcus sp. 23YEL01]|nr:hypothetical protein [Deinococcus sp. 23YEL01]
WTDDTAELQAFSAARGIRRWVSDSPSGLTFTELAFTDLNSAEVTL